MKALVESQIAHELLETGTLSSFKVFDVHGHMGGFSGIWFPHPEATDMVRTMERCGVERLVFSHHAALQDPFQGNRRAQEAIAAFPHRLLGYYAVNPHYAKHIRDIAGNGRLPKGFAGYKILAGYYRTPITCDACIPLWEHANREKLPVLLHTWGGDSCAGCREVETIATKYPDAVILMGHAQYGEWAKAIHCAREFPNVYCELCAAYAVNGLIQMMVDSGIEDKVLFGTDLPWFDPMYGIGCVVFAHISDHARRKILRDNAVNIFRKWL
ncbi:MAG: amidohydrolase family protein [Kiritimatiellae bacterium]|nr:amidohydrolase family protein [Kiritimatiellia bacterium]